MKCCIIRIYNQIKSINSYLIHKSHHVVIVLSGLTSVASALGFRVLIICGRFALLGYRFDRVIFEVVALDGVGDKITTVSRVVESSSTTPLFFLDLRAGFLDVT